MTPKLIQFHKPNITEDVIAEVVAAIKSGWWTNGPRVKQFEDEFGKYIGTKNSVAVSSWTAAAHLALEAIGIKAGDEVIVPSITFTATAEVVCYFNAKPVIVDVDPQTLNILPSAIEKAITRKTKAIIPVHYGGLPCNMDEIIELARQHNLYIIEDAAHAVPSYYKGKKVGSFGDVTCFSFYVTKPLATGEGGMICTDNNEIAERCSVMRLHGISNDPWNRYTLEGAWYYEVISPGYKYNFTDIQAALGISQLKNVDELHAMRKYISDKYDEGFSGNDLISVPVKLKDRQSSLHLYAIQLQLEKLSITRAEFINELKQKGIATSVHFIPLYRHPYYRDTYSLKCEDYPNSENVYPRLISLPIWPGMTDEQINRVIECVNEIAKKYLR